MHRHLLCGQRLNRRAMCPLTAPKATSFSAFIERVEELHHAGDTVIETLGGSEAFLQSMADGMERAKLGIYDVLAPSDNLRLPKEHDARSLCGNYRWFFHFHSEVAKSERLGGHFHLFTAPRYFNDAPDVGLSHLISVELDNTGDLEGFFVPNRWVTDEYIRPASDLIGALKDFSGTEKTPALIVSYWLEALVQLFQSEIKTLLMERDRFLVKMNDTSRAHYLENRAFDRICEWRL